MMTSPSSSRQTTSASFSSTLTAGRVYHSRKRRSDRRLRQNGTAMSGADDLDGGETQTLRLAAALRDPSRCQPLDMSDVLAADDHGVASLLFAALRQTAAWDRQPDSVQPALANMAREAA